MPTDQLRKALNEAGPEHTQMVRLRLIAAGEMALAHSDVGCLIYGALASAMSVDGPDVYPYLTAACMKVNDTKTGRVMELVDELFASDPEQTGLPGALAREVAIAAIEGVKAVAHALNELEITDFVPPAWLDEDPNR